jgi:hypothetical protein
MSDEQPPEDKGLANLTAPKFRPGQSGNPGGRPKSLPRFRLHCRALSWKILGEIRRRLHEAPFADLLEALEVVGDRGGFLSAKDTGKEDTDRARLVLALMAMDQLSGEQRDRAIAALERIAKGDDDGAEDAG